MNDTVTFLDCVNAAAGQPGLVREFERLHNLSRGRTPIERMVDEATGFGDHYAQTFLTFVRRAIWETLPPQQRRMDEASAFVLAALDAKEAAEKKPEVGT